MRVITGSAKGRKLVTPDGINTRPTVERVKEGVFSALQFDLEGRRILDLFAGSGQMGIEALSRGAKRCTFVDNSKDSLECINKNIEACGFSDIATVKATDSVGFIAVTGENYDIAFLDPPYKNGLIEKVMPSIDKKMSDFGIVVCEHAIDEPLEEQYGGLKLFKDYRYGKVVVSIYKRNAN